MTVRLLNPEGLVTIPLYHHVAIATGGTQVHLAGQVAWDEDGRLVADDLAGQVAHVYCNVAKALAATGAEVTAVVDRPEPLPDEASARRRDTASR